MDVDVVPASEAAAAISEGDPAVCAVVIDALRASATAISLLEAGATGVIPVAGDDADRFGADVLKAGEHHGERIEGFDFGNSPLEIRERAALVEGEEVVLRTTNGTRCVDRVRDASTVMMGSLLNAEGILEVCCERLPADSRVIFVPAGRRGDPAPEDTYTAVTLARRLQAALGDAPTASAPESDVAETITTASTNAMATAATAGNANSAGHAVEFDESDLRPAEAVFVESDTGEFLASKGWTEDVRFCARENVFEAVPVLEDGRFIDDRSTDGRSANGPADGSSTATSGTGSEGSAPSAKDTESDPETSHLNDVEDGCGCTEIWEHLSQQRE